MGSRVIFFDAGGTLLTPYPSVGEVYAEVARCHGVVVAPEFLDARFKHVWAEKDQRNERLAQAGQATPLDEKLWWKGIVWKVFLGTGPFHDFDRFFDELFLSFGKESRWRLFPETIEVLRILKEQHFRMAVVSNWDSRLHSLLKETKISTFFEQVIISAEVGVSKPEGGIFSLALTRMGVPAGAVTHVGDHLQDDVAGALAAGLGAIWVDRDKATTPAPLGGQKVADLRGILPLLLEAEKLPGSAVSF